MTAPGVSIKESDSTGLSVTSSTTAVPVFVGYFVAKDGSSLEGGECIRIDNWLDFSQRFIGSHVSVDFPSIDSPDLIQPEDDSEVVIANPAVSVFEGETAKFTFTFVGACTNGQKLKLHLNKADSGYGRKPAKLVFSPSEETEWLDFKSEVPDDITLDVNLPLGATGATLYLDTVFDRDTIQEPLELGVYRFKSQVHQEAIFYTTIYPIFEQTTVTTMMSLSYFAVQCYFQNGGGPCYLLPLATGDAVELVSLSATIREQAPDASLLLCSETDMSLEVLAGKPTKSSVYSALDSLLSTQPSCFLIADSVDGVAKPSTTNAQTAVYYPSLQTRWFSRPADEAIALSGYTDVDGNSVGNLATLKSINPGAYDYMVDHIQSELGDEVVTLPPSAAIAGAYCRNDREHGVWKAPANLGLYGVRGVETVVADAEQSVMNKAGVNVVRWFSDRGAVIWGARTQDVTSDDWRYIPVRRLFNSAERDIQQMMRTVVFEPNNQATWERVRGAIDNYLNGLSRLGALLGDTPQQAYFVQVGENLTMTPEEIDDGKLIVKVGMSAVRPAEFIVLQFSQKVQ